MTEFKAGDRITYWDDDTYKGGVVVAVDGLVNHPTSGYGGFGRITVFLDGERKSRRVSPSELVHEAEPELPLNEYQKLYYDFWAPIIEDANGNLNLDQLQRELWDYHMVMTEVGKVYSEATGGQFGKLNTQADAVLEAIKDHYFGWAAEYVSDMTPAEIVEWIEENSF